MNKVRVSHFKSELGDRLRGIFDNTIANIVVVLLLAFIPLIWGWVSGPKRADWVFWAVVLGLLSVALLLAVRVWRQNAHQVRTLRSALGILNALTSLDGSLLVLLPNLVLSSDKETAIEQLLREFLRDSTKVFNGDVSRALIVRPDPQDTQNYLIPWVGYQMPPQTLSSSHKFYIGFPSDKKPGIAGKVYKSQEVVVVHFDPVTWKPDDEDYIIFDYDRPYPPYRSFVGVPIIGQGKECLGVLCFDSYHPTVFDAPEVQSLLLALGRRIASAALIYAQFRNIQ